MNLERQTGMEIYILRHGQTVWNKQKLLQGSADIELNEKGRELAGITGANLEGIHFDRIYSSPLIRAYETACLVRGHRNIPIIRDNRLRELCFGINEGKNLPELLADTDNPFHYFFDRPELYVAPEGGETFDEITQRAKSFMQEMVEPLKGECHRIMIVAHGAMNKAILRYIKGHGVSEYWSGGLQRNCAASIVEYDGKYRVIEEGKVFYPYNENK